MTAAPARPLRSPVALLALCGLLLATGCCPDLMVSQASPSDTLLSWQSSLCQWMGDSWDVLVDLWTAESGPSDLVLFVRVTESGSSYRFEVRGVWVP